MKQILREIGMIARCFESIANIEYKEYQLSKNQYIYLVRVAEHPGIILEKLCELIKVDRSTASRAVKKLVQQGFIKKVDENNTGKKIKLFITEKGNEKYTILKRDEEYSIDSSLKGFSEQEKEAFLGYLTRLRINVEPDWEASRRHGSRSVR